MAYTERRQAAWALAGMLALAGGVGCAAAAAGAGAGIYLTSQGAKSLVNGSVTDVSSRARAVLESDGITLDESKTAEAGKERELKGKKGDLDITVSMKRESATTTTTEVSARKNIVEWDKDYAKDLLGRIVKESPAGTNASADSIGRDTATVSRPDTSTGGVKIMNEDTMPVRRDSVPAKDSVPQ